MSKEVRNQGRQDRRLHRQPSSYRQEFDPSKVARHNSHRNPTTYADRETDRLGRTSTFHHDTSRHPSSHNRPEISSPDSARLSRKSSLPHRFSNSSSSNSNNNNNNNSHQLSDSERKDRKRRQNTESARRTRERRKAEMERLEKVYDANAIRIKELEIIADDLSRELRRNNTISDPKKNGMSYESNEERPKWFGAPF